MKWLIEKLGLTPTLDSVAWLSKGTTWLSALQAAFGAALIAWLAMDTSMRAEFPKWVIWAIGGGVVATAFLTTFISNVRQQKVAAKVEAKTGIVPPAAPPPEPKT